MRTVSLIALACYFCVARGVGNLYPFSTFSMYSGQVASSASRVAVRVGGELREVTDFEGWELAEPLELGPEACSDLPAYYTIGYLDDEAAAHIEGHRGTGTQSVELVRHIWRFSGPDVREEECVLHRAKATPR
jgi:hypothetical protein